MIDKIDRKEIYEEVFESVCSHESQLGYVAVSDLIKQPLAPSP